MSNTTYVFINFSDNAPKGTKGTKKLCVARMVNNEYTVVWDARTPADSTLFLRYSFSTDYYVAVADKDDEDGAPKVLAGPKAVTTGQTATYTGGSFTVRSDADGKSRSFTYLNVDPTNPTRAVLTQALDVMSVPKSSAGFLNKLDFLGLAADADADPPTTPISFSPEVPKVSGSYKVVPRWNAYAGDGSGSAVDSLAFWWTDEDVKAGSVIGPEKIQGPSLTNPDTIVFDALPGSQVNVFYSKTGWSQASIKPPTPA